MNEQEINEMRMLSLSAHVLVPMIEDLHKYAYEKLLAEFRNGNIECVALIATCNAYKMLLEEIEIKLNNYENMEKE